MTFETARRSHPGGRNRNEDFAGFAVVNGAGCWIVADGLGGHGAGDVASQAAVRRVLERFEEDPTPGLDRAHRLVADAHTAVLEAQEQARFPGMRTTLSLLLAHRRGAVWAHVGDTRIYQLRRGVVVRQTEDHSVLQMLVDAGKIEPEDIRAHPERSRILRALGQEGAPKPDTWESGGLEAGDAFLLCSDGWWEYVTEREMELDHAKSEAPDDWLDHMSDRILTRASGEFDNLTAIGVFVRGR